MKSKYLLSAALLLATFCITTVHAAGNVRSEAGLQDNGVYSSQYNPWRAQQQRQGNNRHRSVTAPQDNGVRPQSSYGLIPSRQHEYRRYVQQLNTYYEMHDGLPWWAGSNAVPHGSWPMLNNF